MDTTTEASCLDCLIKHVGTAQALLAEYFTGRHPESAGKAIGELTLAERHAADKWSECGAVIRTSRKAFESTREIDLTQLHTVLVELERCKQLGLEEVVSPTASP